MDGIYYSKGHKVAKGRGGTKCKHQAGASKSSVPVQSQAVTTCVRMISNIFIRDDDVGTLYSTCSTISHSQKGNEHLA
jgi:hypothetical protein